MSDLYLGHRLVRAGRAHLSAGTGSQDHATVRSVGPSIVLAVADGVGLYGGRPSHSQVGAYLVAELAAEGAAHALALDPLDPPDPKGMIGRSLYHGLRGLFSELSPGTYGPALATTLLVAVLTPRGLRIWASGDGAWGATPADPWAGASYGPDTSVSSVDGAAVLRGARRLRRLTDVVGAHARRSPEAVAGALGLALELQGQVRAAWVATDGIRDEVALDTLLASGPDEGAAHGALERPDGCDDLGVAWAADRRADADRMRRDIAARLFTRGCPVHPNTDLSAGGICAECRRTWDGKGGAP